MGYFNFLVNANFRKDKDGNTVYFPNGRFGKGSIILDEQTEKYLLKYNKWLYLINTLLIPILCGLGAGIMSEFGFGRDYSALWIILLISVLYLTISFPWAIATQRKLLKNLSKIDWDKTVSFREATFENKWPLADKLNLGAILFCLFVSVILLFLAPLIMSNTAFIVGALAFWLSVICVIIFVQMWHYKIGATMKK